MSLSSLDYSGQEPEIIDGFTFELGVEYLEKAGILDECMRDFFAKNPEIGIEVFKNYLSEKNEHAIKILREWCLSDNIEYWKEFLEERGYENESL